MDDTKPNEPVEVVVIADESAPDGLSDHDLLLEVRNDVQEIATYVRNEFGRRPTRGEMMGLLGGAGTLSGIVFGVVRLFGG